MKRTSKYLDKQFGSWKCIYVGVDFVQCVKTKRSKKRAKRPGHQTYYYCFARLTSDGKADKIIRLCARQAAQVYRGQTTVEEILECREQRAKKKAAKFSTMISYHFI